MPRRVTRTGSRVRKIRLAPDFSVPLSIVTEPIGVFANRGKGKSNAAHLIVERVYPTGVPVWVIDWKGDWYGIRAGSDGKANGGLSIPIFGGDHGDKPLPPESGALMADFVSTERISAIFDLSHLSKTQARRWMMDFAERLYRINREPALLVVDEADVLIPQRLSAELMRLLGAMEDIAKRGRQRGLGIIVISQRVQDVNKSVTDLLETLFIFGITGYRMRRAILDWIDDHGEPAEAKMVVDTLSALEAGEAWVWSPAWLRILQRVRFDRIETFDSHYTPEAGVVRREPKTLADVDLGQLTDAIEATIEETKANDPKELRRQIAALQRELQDQPAAVSPEPILLDKERKALGEVLSGLRGVVQDIERAAEAVGYGCESLGGLENAFNEVITQTMQKIDQQPTASVSRTPSKPLVAPRAPKPTAALKPRQSSGPGVKMGKAERKILSALAQMARPLNDRQICLLASYKPGGHFNNTLGTLRKNEWITGGPSEREITDDGLEALGSYDELPTGRDMLRYWYGEGESYGELGKAAALILRTLVECWPETMTDDEIRAATGYKEAGHFNNSMGVLRGLGFIGGSPQKRCASDELGEARG